MYPFWVWTPLDEYFPVNEIAAPKTILSPTTFAKVVGDKIILGSAISLTGKYSSNGVHTQNGYNMAVDRINSMGGVKVGGKTYKFEIIYYDDESNPKRAAQLAERLISVSYTHLTLPTT